MPPPRPIRASRLCYPSWSARQTRWVSNGVRDEPSGSHQNPLQLAEDAELLSAETSSLLPRSTPGPYYHHTPPSARTWQPILYARPPRTKIGRKEPSHWIHTSARSFKPFDSLKTRSRNSDVSRRSAVGDSTQEGKPSSSGSTPSTLEDTNAQSLLEELFPESSPTVQTKAPRERESYPKLDLPNSVPLVRRVRSEPPKSLREHLVESFQKRSEQITVLQLAHCSTALSEVDFRRLASKGTHIPSWVQDGELYKIIPGRDPLSLERLPFYYLLFKSPQSALAYQKNASRLHKLSSLHQPSSILSAIPPPKGLVNEGEDIHTATSSYLLTPPGTQLTLHVVMQPYNPALRNLISQGGYKPIVPNNNDKGKPIYKVLMHIEGYEPSQWDLWQIFARHAHECGIIWPFHGDSVTTAIHRLRDITDLKTKLLPISSTNPRAASRSMSSSESHHNSTSSSQHDDSYTFLSGADREGSSSTASSSMSPVQINQLVTNRVYNRWIIEFEEEDAARRFALMWHRKVLPEVLKQRKAPTAWRDVEETRVCNAEYLW